MKKALVVTAFSLFVASAPAQPAGYLVQTVLDLVVGEALACPGNGRGHGHAHGHGKGRGNGRR